MSAPIAQPAFKAAIIDEPRNPLTQVEDWLLLNPTMVKTPIKALEIQTDHDFNVFAHSAVSSRDSERHASATFRFERDQLLETAS